MQWSNFTAMARRQKLKGAKNGTSRFRSSHLPGFDFAPFRVVPWRLRGKNDE
jgi:hypothetical protein